MRTDPMARSLPQRWWPPLLSLLLGIAAADAQPNGGRIAYASGEGLWLDVFVMDENGGHAANLTNSPDAQDWPTSWSPDGRQLLFVSDRGVGGAMPHRYDQQDVYVMDADGGNVRQLTQTGGCIHARWSPDGRRIAMTCGGGDHENFDVLVMNADGSEVANLTAQPSMELGLTWSPDSRYVAFASFRDGGEAIYQISADGWELSLLVALPGFATLVGLDWSPDGTRFVFAYADPLASDDSAASLPKIYVADTDGGNRRQLTHGPSVDATPVWSPDGQRIAFTRSVMGEGAGSSQQHDIFVIDADGGNLRNLTNSPGPDFAPAWGPGLSASSAVRQVSWGHVKLGSPGNAKAGSGAPPVSR